MRKNREETITFSQLTDLLCQDSEKERELATLRRSTSPEKTIKRIIRRLIIRTFIDAFEQGRKHGIKQADEALDKLE